MGGQDLKKCCPYFDELCLPLHLSFSASLHRTVDSEPDSKIDELVNAVTRIQHCCSCAMSVSKLLLPSRRLAASTSNFSHTFAVETRRQCRQGVVFCWKKNRSSSSHSVASFAILASCTLSISCWLLRCIGRWTSIHHHLWKSFTTVTTTHCSLAHVV